MAQRWTKKGKKMKTIKTPYLRDVVDLIDREDTHTIEVHGKTFVRVVRCKDCRHSDGFGLCPMDFIDPEGFCYKGKPKNTWKKLECGGYECTECGHVVDTMTKFCPECGSDKRWRKE